MRYVDGERWEKEVRAVISWPGNLPPRLTQSLIDKINETELTDAKLAKVAELRKWKAKLTRLDLPDRQSLGLWYQAGQGGARTWTLRCGKHHYKIGNARAMSLEEAQRRARKDRNKVQDGQDPQAAARIEAERQQTVRQYLVYTYAPRVLRHLKSGGVPVGTDGKIDEEGKPAGIYASLLAPVWAQLLDRPLLALTRDHIEEVLTAHKAKGAKGGTLRRLWGMFGALLRDASDREVLPAELARRLLRRPDALAGSRDGEHVRWLGQEDPGERQRFKAALDAFTTTEPGGGAFVQTACTLALETGMRAGEILGLTDAQINLRERTVTLRAADTKGNKKHTVKLNDPAVNAIARWRQVRATLPVQGIRGELFPRLPDKPPNHWSRRLSAGNRDFHQVRRAAGITERCSCCDRVFHFHDQRHDFAVRLLRETKSLPAVRDALGHSKITVTEKYAHAIPTETHEAVLAMRAF